MAVIYDICTGNIIPENSGVTRLDKYAGLPGCNTALQTIQTDATAAEAGPCDDYMTLIQQLLKEL
ncbi:MAG: hypothetical protein DRQ45_02670 [Gammaproteobacteria bacterium]|nr:MAG: hypothetical protein DRQ45_02670 [Gammaproteobacteria bacterium]